MSITTPPASNDAPRPSILRRTLRRLGILTGTGLTIALAVGLVVSGSGLIAARAAGDSTPVQDPVLPVEVAPLVVQDSYAVTAAFTGQVEAARSVDLGFETGGTLAEVLVDEGDRVAAGDVLARLDIRSLQAERAAQSAARDAAIARRDLAKLTAERQQRLAASDFSSTQRADEARFRLAEAEAEIAQLDAALLTIDIALTKSEITAPFAGTVSDRLRDEGARLGSGTPVLRLEETDAPHLRVGLPDALASALPPQTEVTVTLPRGTGTARLDRLRPDLDPATRTRAALFTLDQPAPSGTLVSLELAREVPGNGAWVPLSALSEGIQGLWTLYLLDDSNTLRRESVEVLHATGSRAFVAGTFPHGARYVPAGAHRVAPGQRVTPIAAEG